MTDHDLADRLDEWAPKLTALIPWLDLIDKVAVKAGHPELASTEMQDDLRAMCEDAAAAAARLRHLDALLDAIGDPDELVTHELDMSDGTVNTPEHVHEAVRGNLRRIAGAAASGGEASAAPEVSPEG